MTGSSKLLPSRLHSAIRALLRLSRNPLAPNVKGIRPSDRSRTWGSFGRRAAFERFAFNAVMLRSQITNAKLLEKAAESRLALTGDFYMPYETTWEGDKIRELFPTDESRVIRESDLENVLSRLNALRGPIAHCSILAEDEIVKLNLSVRDWFRLMG